MKMTAIFEMITPEQALDWLTAETNCNNRKLKPAIVRKYARDMQANNWMFNGDTIKFDWNGKLFDGQHRLNAVIELNHPVQFLVVRNLNPEAYTAIDTGARRTHGDMMQHAGSKHASSVAAAAKVVYWYENGRKDFNVAQSVAELVAIYRQHPGLEEHVARYDNTPALRKKLRIGAAWPAFTYLAGAGVLKELEEYIEGISDGIGLGKGDPRYSVREWFLNRLYRKRTASNDERFSIIAKGWNAFLQGRSLQVISYRFNEEPPVLIRDRKRFL
jgi:hypothetical protein